MECSRSRRQLEHPKTERWNVSAGRQAPHVFLSFRANEANVRKGTSFPINELHEQPNLTPESPRFIREADWYRVEGCDSMEAYEVLLANPAAFKALRLTLVLKRAA